MEPEFTAQRWSDVRDHLTDASERFAQSITQPRRANRRAIGEWSIAETAAHVALVARMNAGMVSSERSSLGIDGLDDLVHAATLADIAEINTLTLTHFTERNPDELAEQIRQNVDLILTRSADLAPHALVPWLGGAQLPVISVLAHQLNEFLVHGVDVARASATRSAIAPGDGAFAFDLFLVGLLGGRSGNLLTGGTVKGGRRIAVEFRSAHTRAVVIAIDRGQVTVEAPGAAVDARIRFDPGSLMLAIFRRISPLRLVTTGKIAVSGKRPWLAVPFLQRIQTP